MKRMHSESAGELSLVRKVHSLPYIPRNPKIYYKLHRLLKEAILSADEARRNERIARAEGYLDSLSDLWTESEEITKSKIKDFYGDFVQIRSSILSQVGDQMMSPFQSGLIGSLSGIIRFLERNL